MVTDIFLNFSKARTNFNFDFLFCPVYNLPSCCIITGKNKQIKFFKEVDNV